jgi:peroxiredoxin Q/BCP
LSGARRKVVALFFYPGDESPVCTKQMCSVRDNWARYQQTGAEVVGVNTDSGEAPQLRGEPQGADTSALGL